MEYMNDYDPKMIGKRIKETAQSKGYTAEKLSEITGNGIHTINRIYQGTSISTEYICQLSQVLGVSTDYLLLGKKDRMEEKPNFPNSWRVRRYKIDKIGRCSKDSL